MDLADLRILVDYHYWARDRVLDASAPLTAEQFTRDLGSSFRSVRDTLTLVAIGLAVGVPAAFAATRLVRSQLFGLGAADPASFMLAVVVLSGVAALAGFFPARRAARVDPMVALRYE